MSAVPLRHERGTITLWLLGLCLLLLGLGGISLDLWRSFSERRAVAAAADAAALAGASAVDATEYRSSGRLILVPDEAEQRARASLSGQLDRTALRGADIRAAPDAVTVVVHGRVGVTLLSLFGAGDLEVRVTATAQPRRSA
jgi:uncharacterized membrane protein